MYVLHSFERQHQKKIILKIKNKNKIKMIYLRKKRQYNQVDQLVMYNPGFPIDEPNQNK